MGRSLVGSRPQLGRGTEGYGVIAAAIAVRRPGPSQANSARAANRLRLRASSGASVATTIMQEPPLMLVVWRLRDRSPPAAAAANRD